MNKKVIIVIVVIMLAVFASAVVRINKKNEELQLQSIPGEIYHDVEESEKNETEAGGQEAVLNDDKLEENETDLQEESIAKENQILCKAKSEKVAQEIADKIGGQLVGYMDGIGIIAIEETTSELMKRLDEEGLGDLELYPNLNYSTMEKKIGF